MGYEQDCRERLLQAIAPITAPNPQAAERIVQALEDWVKCKIDAETEALLERAR